MCGVLKSAGSRISDKYKSDIKETLIQLQSTAHEGNRLAAARCLGILCNCLSDEQLITLMKVRKEQCIHSNNQLHLSGESS